MGSSGLRMTFWQENYAFIKDVYDMRHQKMVEWMENVEKSISRIMADKVYTSAEFKRERDNFHALCKDLERAEVKKWLQQILEILMAERGKEERTEQLSKLDSIIKKHEELIPTVLKTQVKVDLYWKCYAYGDELKPHIEFLDGIMLSSTRDIAPSCIENVEELIERQEKSLTQLETKRGIVRDLIAKGKQLLENPDKPKFLDSHVKRIEDGWDETKEKASTRLQLLSNTKAAWEGYGEGLETIAVKFDAAEEEIKKIKKRFNLQAAFEDLEKRQKILNDTKLHDIKNNSDKMTPEDRVSYTMDLREEIGAKVEIINAKIAAEKELLPQGDTVPKDAQDYKDELERIRKYVEDLYTRCSKECDNFSEDVKYWAQYRTGIKEFTPWLVNAEGRSAEGLSKPQTLDEANAMYSMVQGFEGGCVKFLNILNEAAAAANRMTTHKEADDEVKALKERYDKVKAVSDEWMKKSDTLVKEWKLLDNTVNELNSWVAKDRGAETEQNFSLEKMESTLGELKNIFKEKERLVENL